MPQGEPKKDGPAERAPQEAEEDKPLRPISESALQSSLGLQMVRLRGYFRFRYDNFHNLNLGMLYTGTDIRRLTPPPFPIARECANAVNGPGSAGAASRTCNSKTLGSANIRLRLAPEIRVTESVRVYTMMDVLDNTIMGSTPNSLALDGSLNGAAPSGFFADGQSPPKSDAIRFGTASGSGGLGPK